MTFKYRDIIGSDIFVWRHLCTATLLVATLLYDDIFVWRHYLRRHFCWRHFCWRHFDAIPLFIHYLVYDTARSGYQVINKAVHDESVNPITDSEARMLWLGIGANLLSFGAMCTSMRMVSLAANGENFSASFCALINILNGLAVTVGGFTILNSTIFLIEH
jgi:hypothetical protein